MALSRCNGLYVGRDAFEDSLETLTGPESYSQVLTGSPGQEQTTSMHCWG